MAGDARGIRAGRAYVELGVSDRFTSALKRAEQRLQAMGDVDQRVGIGLLGVGTAAAAGLFAVAKSYANFGDDLLDTATKTGASVEALSELDYVAKLNGTTIEGVAGGLKVMQRSLSEAAGGAEGASEKFDMIGLSVEQLRAMSPDKQLEAIASGIMRLVDPADRARAAMDIFGRSGADLLPILAMGGKGIAAMREQARALGLTVSTDTAKQAASLNDTLDTTLLVVRSAAVAMGSALAPAIDHIAKLFAAAVMVVTEFIKAHPELVRWILTAAGALVAIGGTILALGLTLKAAALGVRLVTVGIQVMNTVLEVTKSIMVGLVNPTRLVVGGLIALGSALLLTSETGQEALKNLFGMFDGITGQLDDAIKKAQAAVDLKLSIPDIESLAKVPGASAALDRRLAPRSISGAQNLDVLKNTATDDAKRTVDELKRANTGIDKLVNLIKSGSGGIVVA